LLHHFRVMMRLLDEIDNSIITKLWFDNSHALLR